MVDTGTILVAGGTIFSSVVLVEYRLFRERQRENREQKLRWARSAEVILDQIERECRNISGMTVPQKKELNSNKRETVIFNRIQELKDLMSEMPDDVGTNTEYFMRDTWVKFEMSGIGTSSFDWDMITNDTKQQAEKAKEDIEKYRTAVESQDLIGRLIGEKVEDYTDRELD